MFPKEKRLRKEKDIEATFKGSYSAFSKILGLKARKNDLDYNRYTVIIGKKVSKLAVIRNLKKRKIRAILEELDESVKKGHDIIVLGLKGFETKDYFEIKKNTKYLLKKTGLIN